MTSLLQMVLMAALSVDVSGKWSGTSEFTNRDGEVRNGRILMTLKQSGENVTGTAGPSVERLQEIRNGKVSGDKLTFEVVDQGGKGVVELTTAEESLKGEAKFQRDYGVVSMKLTLKREAADVSGKWSGTTELATPDGQTQSGRIFLSVKQSAAEVTGIAGPSEDRMVEIRNGKVAGDKFTFEAEGGDVKVLVELTLADGALKGEARVHRDGAVVPLKVALKRE